MSHHRRVTVAASSLLALATALGLSGQASAADVGGSETTSTAPTASTAPTEELVQAEEAEALRMRRLAEALEEQSRQQARIDAALHNAPEQIRNEAQASELQNQIARHRVRMRADRRDRSRSEELHGLDIFIPPTNAGAPGECNRDPIPTLERRAAPTLDGVLSELDACYYALMDRGDPYLNRRVAYSGVSSFGALGAAIGGSAAATSTTVAWGGLALLPILVEGTFDRPEFDGLDRVTARGLHWVNGRAIQMEALQRRLQLQASDLEKRIGDVQAALSRDGEARLHALADEQDDGDADAAVSAAAARRMRTQVRDAIVEAQALARTTRGTGDDIGVSLPPWALSQFDLVMDNYREKRLAMTLRPQAAARSIIALPLTTLSNLVRGGQNFQTEDYFAAQAAANLTGLDQPLDLRAKPAGVTATRLTIVPEEFAEGDRAELLSLQNVANALIDEMAASVALLVRTDAANTARAPNFLTSNSNTNQTREAATEQQLAPPPSPPAPKS